jgi:hypothetical protein
MSQDSSRTAQFQIPQLPADCWAYMSQVQLSGHGQGPSPVTVAKPEPSLLEVILSYTESDGSEEAVGYEEPVPGWDDPATVEFDCAAFAALAEI